MQPRSSLPRPIGVCVEAVSAAINSPLTSSAPPRTWCTRCTCEWCTAAARCCSSHDRSSSSLLICADCMRRMHRVQGAADDVTALLIAVLTASTRANRPWQRRPGLQAPAIRWQPEELLLVSGCSGHADRSGPDVDAAASCSYLSDCMSLSGHRHLLRALCWLAWCCCVPFACASRAPRAERS